MKISSPGRALLLGTCLAFLTLLAVACQEEEPGAPIPGGMPTAAVSGTPTAAEVPGITDTQIILGSHFALSGTWGAAFAIIAGLGTAAHSAVWEDLNEKGVPDLWIMAGNHKWGAEPEKYPWSVALLPDFYVEGTIFGEYISDGMPGKKVGILYENDEYGRDELAGLRNGLDATKNELVSEQSYEITAVSIRSQVRNMKDAGAEVVVGACLPPSCAQLIKEADRLGWHPQFLISYVNSDPMMFQYASPELMEGIITLQASKLSDWTDDPAVAEHHRIMEEYGDFAAGNFTIAGQNAAVLTVETLSRTCDNLTREGLMDAVHSLEEYQLELILPGITITLSPTDHLVTEAMRMLRAHGGKWEYFGEIISFRD
jgi:branched-chain amino acid transport system substrate-binding protein